MSIRKIGNIEYNFTRKRVKNINLRIHSDGTIAVSAPSYVPPEKVDEFVLSKADFIENARRKLSEIKPKSSQMREFIDSFTDEDYEHFFRPFVDRYYLEFKQYGIKYPMLRFKDMKSRWGSCIPSKNIITLNKQLAAVPRECVEYVVVHEFCHFLEPNHSQRFYAHVERHMPDWRERRKKLNKCSINVS